MITTHDSNLYLTVHHLGNIIMCQMKKYHGANNEKKKGAKIKNKSSEASECT